MAKKGIGKLDVNDWGVSVPERKAEREFERKGKKQAAHSDEAMNHPAYKLLADFFKDKELDEDSIIAVGTFLRDMMAEEGYSLIFGSRLKVASNALWQMMGGDIMECSFILDVLEVQHRKRIDKGKESDIKSAKGSWSRALDKTDG